MGVKVTNNSFGTISAGISSSDTTVTLDSGQGARFPTLGAGDFFFGTLVDTSNNIEIIKVTARSTDSMTVTRAQDNTTARAFAIGDRFELRPTAALFETIRDEASVDGITSSAAGTAITIDSSDDTTIENDLTVDGVISVGGGSGGASVSLRSGGDLNIYAANNTDVAVLFCDTNDELKTNGDVKVGGDLILDSVAQSEWGMVKLASAQLTGSYSQVEISISPSYSGYSVYKIFVNSFQLAADGELWCNYMYGTTKKAGWYGGFSRAGEGNSVGQQGFSNQSQCEIIGTSTTSSSGNSYPFTGEFTCYPLESGNRGRFVWQAVARISSGLSQSIFGGALTTNTNTPDKIVFYSNKNIVSFDYVMFGLKV